VSMHPFMCQGRYFIESSVAYCEQCPIHSESDPSAASIYDCYCSTSYYLEDTDENTTGITCTPCPLGTDCSQPRVTQSTLPILAGYWRPNSQSVDVQRCPDAHLNSGCKGTYLSDGGSSGRRLENSMSSAASQAEGCHGFLVYFACCAITPMWLFASITRLLRQHRMPCAVHATIQRVIPSLSSSSQWLV